MLRKLFISNEGKYVRITKFFQHLRNRSLVDFPIGDAEVRCDPTEQKYVGIEGSIHISRDESVFIREVRRKKGSRECGKTTKFAASFPAILQAANYSNRTRARPIRIPQVGLIEEDAVESPCISSHSSFSLLRFRLRRQFLGEWWRGATGSPWFYMRRDKVDVTAALKAARSRIDLLESTLRRVWQRNASSVAICSTCGKNGAFA